ncbi:hypothetical protein [Idiomarina ramblicola]|uniref:Uncharacterized protein n=1 Tax=Idiomarina ramblicola TaxID=263724 RepID=A0A432YYX1_9GAMM|nr:hypothetical protein [Idiomarina ramblicola]RUO68814.1 hypothetical protein CWI78_07825 [Idiomarina ramblicola]
MRELPECCEKAASLLKQHDVRQLYRLVQFIDEEYQQNRWPELLPLYAQQNTSADNEAVSELLSVCINALHCGYHWSLHTHYRRILAAACISEKLNSDPNYWKQRQLRQPLWLTALEPLRFNSPDIVIFRHWVNALTQVQLERKEPAQAFFPLLNGHFRYRFWMLLSQQDTLPIRLTGQKFSHKKNSQTAVLLGFEGKHQILALIHKLDSPFYVTPEETHHWELNDKPLTKQQMSALVHHRLLKHEQTSAAQQTPRQLLKAINRYANANGALNAVIQHVNQLPFLANSLHAAVQQSERIGYSEASRMDLKQAYLWLGSKRSSVILATAFLQHQFSLNTIPLHKTLMQKLGLLTTILQHLSELTGINLPTPAPLLALLSGSDLFRHPELLKSAKWPRPKQVEHCYSTCWVGSALDISDFRRSRQLVKRWQLPPATENLLDPDKTEHNSLSALFFLAHYLTLSTYYPEVSLSSSVKSLLKSSCQQLKIDGEQLTQIKTKTAFDSHCYSPL